MPETKKTEDTSLLMNDDIWKAGDHEVIDDLTSCHINQGQRNLFKITLFLLYNERILLKI